MNPFYISLGIPAICSSMNSISDTSHHCPEVYPGHYHSDTTQLTNLGFTMMYHPVRAIWTLSKLSHVKVQVKAAWFCWIHFQSQIRLDICEGCTEPQGLYLSLKCTLSQKFRTWLCSCSNHVRHWLWEKASMFSNPRKPL